MPLRAGLPACGRVPRPLKATAPTDWVTAEDGAWDLVDHLEATRHYKLMTPAQARSLLRRDPFERDVANLLQYRKPKPPRKKKR